MLLSDNYGQNRLIQLSERRPLYRTASRHLCRDIYRGDKPIYTALGNNCWSCPTLEWKYSEDRNLPVTPHFACTEFACGDIGGYEAETDNCVLWSKVVVKISNVRRLWWRHSGYFWWPWITYPRWINYRKVLMWDIACDEYLNSSVIFPLFLSWSVLYIVHRVKITT